MTASGTLGRLGPVLHGRKVVLCLGSGGVGKTTTAAVLALGLARQGERVVVLTIDPARRLADALGLSGRLSNEPTLISTDAGDDGDSVLGDDGVSVLGDDGVSVLGDDGVSVLGDDGVAVLGDGGRGSGEVWATMLDPAETFRQVILAEAGDPEQAERILGNRLFRNLTTTLSGTNEYMAAERLHQLDADDRFDRIIVDTPPSRHVLDFLDSPGRLTRFVDHRLYRSVLAPGRGLLRPLNAGAKVVMRLLAGLVGSSLVDDVVGFFADFEGLDKGFRRRAAEIDELLAGPSTAYLLITAPRTDRLAEAEWILDNLADRDRHPDGILVNRVLPFAPADSGRSDEERSGHGDHDRLGGDDSDRDARSKDGPLARNLRQLQTLAAQEQRLIASLAERISGPPGSADVAIVQLSEQLVPVHDLAGLEALVDELSNGETSSISPEPRS